MSLFDSVDNEAKKIEQDLRMECIKLANGIVDHAESIYRWVKNIPQPSSPDAPHYGSLSTNSPTPPPVA